MYPILTDDMFPPELLQEPGAGLAPRPGHSSIPHCVQPAGAALPAGGCQHQAGQPQIPVSAVVSVPADGCEDQLGVSPSGSGQPPGLIRPLAC